jgi:hypothetical protein
VHGVVHRDAEGDASDQARRQGERRDAEAEQAEEDQHRQQVGIIAIAPSFTSAAPP